MFHLFANIFFIHYVMMFLIGVTNYAVSEKTLVNSSDDLGGKIIGGKPVPVERFPSSVKFYNFGGLCAGTILNSWCVLTAAHCLDHNKEVYDMNIEVGARYIHDMAGDFYDVSNIVIHEEYNKTIPFASDIALIFVTRAIQLGKKAKRALIVNSSMWMKPTVKNIFVSGWGWTKYGGPLSKLGLMETRLSFVTSEDCSRLHQLLLTPDMFCLYGAGARDTCKGDSGGGVIWNDMVIGVVSHGDGCAKRDKPSVYANVWYFRQWIQSKVEYFYQNACEILEGHKIE